MDATGWAVVIGSIVIGLTSVLNLVLTFLERQRAFDREVAKIVREEEVKEEAAKRERAAADSREKLATQVEVIHKATNSLVTQLIDTTKSDSLQTGRAEGRAEAVAVAAAVKSPDNK